MNKYNGDLILYICFCGNVSVKDVYFDNNFYCYVVVDVKCYIGCVRN